MITNRFTPIKDVFIDDRDGSDYINLEKSMIVYNQILSSLQKPLKLILFYGRPGSGKTFLLNKIKQDLVGNKVIFFPYPFFSEKEFLHTLYKEIFDKEPSEEINSYDVFLRLYKKDSKKDTKKDTSKESPKTTKRTTKKDDKKDEDKLKKNPITIMLDEAQMYPTELIEKIRLMADTHMFKFLFTIHKTGDSEDILAKEYFQTRIWESIELESIDEKEVKVYINKKIKNAIEEVFCDDDYKLIADLTNGNLRTINKLMYKVFELFEFYEHNQPSVLQESGVSTKIIEMAAIDRKLINA